MLGGPCPEGPPACTGSVMGHCPHSTLRCVQAPGGLVRQAHGFLIVSTLSGPLRVGQSLNYQWFHKTSCNLQSPLNRTPREAPDFFQAVKAAPGSPKGPYRSPLCCGTQCWALSGGWASRGAAPHGPLGGASPRAQSYTCFYGPLVFLPVIFSLLTFILIYFILLY